MSSITRRKLLTGTALGGIFAAGAANARFLRGGSGAGGVSQTITAVNLSNSSFTSPGTIGEAVGTIAVTMSPASPAFSGTLSRTGANASDFTISGTTLEVNSSGLAAGSYSINVVATQAAATGSPFSQPETITGAAAGSSNLPTTLAMVNYSGTSQAAAPWRFAHLFTEDTIAGIMDLPAGMVLQIKDGGGNTVPYTAARRSTGPTGATICADFLVRAQQAIAGNSTDTWTLSAVSGSWNTTLPASKTAAQIVTDRTTNFSMTGVQFTNLRDNYSQPANGGTFLISAATGYSGGATVPSSHASYYYVAATGPTACDLVSIVVVPSSSLVVYFYETCFLNTSTGAIEKVCLDDIRIKNGPRTIQAQTYRAQIAVTLNGSPVRSWGGNASDGATFNFTSSDINVGAGTINLPGNKFAPGQLVHLTTTGTLPGGVMPPTSIASAGNITVVEDGSGEYTVTVIMANTFRATGVAVQVEITGLTLGSNTSVLNGVHNIGNTVSSTGFSYNAYGPASLGTTVTGTALVTPDYWVSQSVAGSSELPNTPTIFLYSDQFTANGNRSTPGTGGPSPSDLTMTSGGSGTHTIQGLTDIVYWSHTSMRRSDGWVDWISDNSGAFGGEPTYHAVQNIDYYLATHKTPCPDRNITFTHPTEPYPSIWAPQTMNGIFVDYNAGGAHQEYGAPWADPVTRAFLRRVDRLGYCTTGRVSCIAESAGWLALLQDENTGKIWAANGGTYTYPAPMTQHTASQFAFTSASGYEPVDITAPIPVVPSLGNPARANQIPSPFVGHSHFHTMTTGIYCMDGCESLYQHIMELSNALMVAQVVATAPDFASLTRNITTSGGATFWQPLPHAGSDGVRGGAWTVNQVTDAALIADTTRPEKQYWTDVCTDMCAFVAYCRTAFGTNYQAIGGWPCESTSNGPPGITNCLGSGMQNVDDEPSSTNFQEFYVGTAYVASFMKWPTAGMKVVATHGSTPANNLWGTGAPCHSFGNTYGVKVMDHPAWDGQTYTSPPFSTVANMGVWSQGQAGMLWSADGHTVLILDDLAAGPGSSGTNYQIQLVAGDRINVGDGYDVSTPVNGNGSDSALLPTGITNWTWYYAQNITSIPTGSTGVVMSTCTLSTDAAGMIPVTWTPQASMTSTLSGNITSGSTSIPLNTAITTSIYQNGPAQCFIKIDSEYINVANATAVTTLTTRAGTNQMGDGAGQSVIPARGALGSTATSHSTGATVFAFANSFRAIDVQNRTSGCPANTVLYGNGGGVPFGYITGYRQTMGLAAIAGIWPSAGFHNIDGYFAQYVSLGGGQPAFGTVGSAYLSVDTTQIT